MPQTLGKYEILAHLGSGATADVYHARDTVLGREVALKVLKPALVPDAQAYARFIQEARAAAQLFHPHIATVLDIAESDGRYYIAMRYIPGRSLDHILKEDGPLSWDETLRLAQHIGAALDYAHQQGFLHRDVKPSNIVRSTGGEYVLTDFGLTRAMMSTGLTSHSGAVLGTPAYIAPEIWLGEKAVPATDQYALACTVYEALTGHALFTGETPPAIMTAHVLKGARLPAEWPAGMPEGTPTVLEKALSRVADERFASAVEFASALETSLKVSELYKVSEIATPLTTSHSHISGEERIINPDPSPLSPTHPPEEFQVESRPRQSPWMWVGLGAGIGVSLFMIIYSIILPALNPQTVDYLTEIVASTNTPFSQPTTIPPPVELQVGFVSDTGGVFDGSFNEALWNGLLQAQTELGIVPQFIQSGDAPQYVANLTEFATLGYDLILASSFFMGADLANIASLYPDIHFAILDYTYPDPSLPEGNPGRDACVDNIMGIIFKADQAAYLAGYLAAGMATQLDPEDPALGFFGGANIPSVTIYSVGYQHGMDAYNAAHGTSVRMIGWDNATGQGLFTLDFVDLIKGEQYARTLFEEGADIFMAAGGLIGSPGFAVAREYGGYGIWLDTDGYETLDGVQDVILTSVLKHVQPVTFSFIQYVSEGNFQGCSNYIGDMATNGGVSIAPYHDLVSLVPDYLKAEIELIQRQIESGNLVDTGCISFPQWCPQGLFETPEHPFLGWNHVGNQD